MARAVARKITEAPRHVKPASMKDPSHKGICGWCIVRDHEHCSYLQHFMDCPCPCP